MIEIREATVDDAEAAIELESKLFAEDAGVHDPHADITWPSREGRADFDEMTGSDDSIVLLAWNGTEAVGLLMGYATTAGVTRQPVTYAVLRTMYVATTHRRAGIGSLLIDRFLGWARDRGCVEAHVNHYAANESAGALYARHGFEPHSLERVLRLD